MSTVKGQVWGGVSSRPPSHTWRVSHEGGRAQALETPRGLCGGGRASLEEMKTRVHLKDMEKTGPCGQGSC